MSQTPQLTHDGMVISHTMVRGAATVTCTFWLPPQILPMYWERYRLTLNDVRAIVATMPAEIVWLVAMLYGHDVAASAVRPSLARPYQVLVASKVVALRKLLMNLPYQPPDDSAVMDRLDRTTPASMDHVPPLPRVMADGMDDEFVKSLLAPNLHDMAELAGFIEMDGMKVVPVSSEGCQGFVCHRLARWSEYEQIPNTDVPIANLLRVQHNGDIYVLTNEVFLLLL